jgi:predicted RNA binding protein YcfA (HicA-like mRNA interferase family)
MTRTGPRAPASRGTTSDMRAAIRSAEESGWVTELTRGQHIVFRKDGCPPVFAPFTGGRDAARNTLARLRREDRRRRAV